MNTDHWRTLRSHFDALADVPEEERAARLADLDLDADLRAELEALLHADGTPAHLLDATQPGLRLAAPSPPPDTVGPYRIDHLIARGGMGSVYLAHRDTGDYAQTVAIKILRRGLDTDDVLRRFQYERQILARLQHPNIAHLIDGGTTDDGRPFFVMEYVEGQPITQYADYKRLTISERLALFQTVCAAVQYAHQNLVIHRDLKPSNILVMAEGQVKLLDFGIAKLLADEEPTALTATGMRVMTPEYAAPEQVEGQPITTATDVYQLGILLYELLVGTRPFRLERQAHHALEQAIIGAPPTRPSTAVGTATDAAVDTEAIAAARSSSLDRLQRRIRGDLDTIVLQALRKETDRRYGSAAQLAEDVGRHLAGLPVQARPASVAYRIDRFVRRHKVGVGSAVLMLMVLVSAGTFSLVQAQRAMAERDRAQQEALASETVINLLVGLFEQADAGVTEGEAVTVRRVLDEAPARLADELPDQPAIRGRLLSRIGRVYANLSLYPEADSILQEAEAILLEAPEATEHLARTLVHRGWTKRNISAYSEADSLYQAALALLKPLDQHASTALLALLGLTHVTLEQFEFARAESLLAIIGPLTTQLESTEHHASLSQLHTLLGQQYASQNRNADAVIAYGRAVDHGRAAYGDVHSNLIMLLNNQANFLAGIGRYGTADSLFRQALEMNTQLYGDVPMMNRAAIYHAWAIAQRQSGNLAAADTLWEDALVDLRAVLPPDAFQIGAVLNSVASVKRQLGHLEEAEVMFKDVIRRFKQAFGDAHPNTLAAENNLAIVYITGENYEQAITQFEEIRERAQRIFTPPDQYLANFALNLAGAYIKVDRPVEAEPLARNAIAQFDALFTDPHPKRMNARHTLVDLLRRQGRLDEAQAAMRDLDQLGTQLPMNLEHTNSLLVKARLQRDLAQMDSARATLQHLTTMLDSLGVQSGEQYEAALRLTAEMTL